MNFSGTSKYLTSVLLWAVKHPLPAVRIMANRLLSLLIGRSWAKVFNLGGWRIRINRNRERRLIAREIRGMVSKPKVSVVMPVYAPDPEHLRAAIESVQCQSYPVWELCIADDHSPDQATREFLQHLATREPRIKYTFRAENGHIAAAHNAALALAEGDIVVLLDQADRLAPDALYWVVRHFAEHADSGMLYSDEDMISCDGRNTVPFYKPDWSPHLLYQQAYVGHLLAFRRHLVAEEGGFRSGYDGAQDYDLALRISAITRVAHIPRILYHWRQHERSTAFDAVAKPYAHDAGKRALEDALKARYGPRYRCVEDGDYPFTYRPRFTLPEGLKISIIIPTRDRVDLLRACIESILQRSSYTNYEVLVLDNNSCEPETIAYLKQINELDSRLRSLPAPMPFNWSRLNNLGAGQATGNLLVFLNNDTTVITSDWMERLAEYAFLPEVGVVGALLLYPDNTIQHDGVVVGMGGWADHVYKGQKLDHYAAWGYVSPCLTRNVLAVTGACLAIEKSKFEALGGFDEAFEICGSDVELGIRAHKRGLYNVLCAEARLYHHESKTRDKHVPEVDFVQSSLKYEPYRTQRRDPFYNPNLDLACTTPKPIQ